jgi:hypothetical protein
VLQFRINEFFMQNFRRIFKPVSHYNPDSLLHAIFWIAGVSITTILMLTSVIVYEITSREVTRDTMEIAVKASRIMFEQQKAALTSVDSNGKQQLNLDQENITAVDKYFRTYLSNFNVLKIKIYTPQDKIIFSTDQKIIGKTDSNNIRLKRALAGKTDSHMEMKDKMLDLTDEAKFNVAVVETYVPIMINNNVIGVFELYTDVTSYNLKIYKIVTKTLARLAIILLFVFACSYLVIRKLIRLLKDMQQELADKVIQLENALSKVKQLEGIIPICSYCKKIRDDEKSWHQLEQYISSHSEAKFSHGICPECYQREIREINARDI